MEKTIVSTHYFDFLASHPEWEARCHSDHRQIDRLSELSDFCPQGSTFWTFPAQLYATLKADDELQGLAKDGGLEKEGGGGKNLIKGFPGILPKVKFKNSNIAARWGKFADPTPRSLDSLPRGSLLIRLRVELVSPFYSRDDLPFYPTDNPLRRHKIFDVPFLSAAGLKGLLRWADRMSRQCLEDDETSRFLFGTDEDPTVGRERKVKALKGAVYCYPLLWDQGDLRMEVINPQNPRTGGGTNPIKYETLAPKGQGTIFILVPNLGRRLAMGRQRIEALLNAITYLKDFGALSAKSSAGWGRFRIVRANAAVKGATVPEAAASGTTPNGDQGQSDEDIWRLFAPEGKLLPFDANPLVYTTDRLFQISGMSKAKIKRDRPACYALIEQLFEQRSHKQITTENSGGTAWLWGDSGIENWDQFRSSLIGTLSNMEIK